MLWHLCSMCQVLVGQGRCLVCCLMPVRSCAMHTPLSHLNRLPDGLFLPWPGSSVSGGRERERLKARHDAVLSTFAGTPAWMAPEVRALCGAPSQVQCLHVQLPLGTPPAIGVRVPLHTAIFTNLKMTTTTPECLM